MAAVGVIKSGCKKSAFPLLPKNAKYKSGSTPCYYFLIWHGTLPDLV